MFKSTRNKGFSLIELMIVVAVLAIMVMLAYPTYETFITRTKLTELIHTSAPLKTGIVEYTVSVGQLPKPGNVTGFPKQRKLTSWVKLVKIRRPKRTTVFIEVRPTKAVSPEFTNTTAFVLRGVLSGETGNIDWDCGTYDRAARKIPLRYLPSTCRNVMAYGGAI